LLIYATVAYILGPLAISPLSSSLLTSANVAVKENVPFNIMEASPSAPLPLTANRETYFRTIGNFLQNVSTSAWIDESYYVHPFWPAESNTPPLGPKLSNKAETWIAESSVFSAGFECDILSLKSKGPKFRNDSVWQFVQPTTEELEEGTPNEYEQVVKPGHSLWLRMESPKGCQYSLEIDVKDPEPSSGGLVWAKLREQVASNLDGRYMETDHPNFRHTNISTECQDDFLLLVTTPWTVADPTEVFEADYKPTFLSNFTVYGEICRSNYYVARMDVTITTSDSASRMEINQQQFRNKRMPIPKEVFDARFLENMTMSRNWTDYMSESLFGIRNRTVFDGPGIIIGALNDFQTKDMAQKKNLGAEARRFRQRFMGEVLQNSIRQRGVNQLNRTTGKIFSVKRRVVVVTEVAITLAVLLFVSFVLLTFTLHLSRLRRRPLNLSNDPATPLGLATLVAIDRDALNPLRLLDQASKTERELALKEKAYVTSSVTLHEAQALSSAVENITPKFASRLEWRPWVIRLRGLMGLIICLICLIVGLAVLKLFADRQELYRTAFVYQASFSIFNTRISTIAPYSIVPTVLAVAIGLWWDSLDWSFRLLQPYVSMANSSPRLQKGAGQSYRTSYWFWAAIKAFRNKHWILFIVTLGSTLSQVFVVSMSALFERQQGTSLHTETTDRMLELRQVPRLDTFTGDTHVRGNAALQALAKAYSNSATNWMYTGTIQLTLNGPEPAWSHEGWSFVPVDLSSLANTTSTAQTQSTGEVFDENGPIGTSLSASKISLTTSAIRARVECSPMDMTNTSSWLYTWDLTNTTERNATLNPSNLKTGYGMKEILFEGESYNTSTLTHPSLVYCCGNGTETGNSAVGYWSSNNPNSFPHIEVEGVTNFTTKWIHGRARANYYNNSEDLNTSFSGRLVFENAPSIQAVNCKPIIETAEAAVTVNQLTGQVYSYNILGQPVAAKQAWSDPFLTRKKAEDVGKPGGNAWDDMNVTTSYGYYFLNTLLGAAQLTNLLGRPRPLPQGYFSENTDIVLTDKTFNVRDEDAGLNLDFMSYAMYSLVDKEPTALLDPTTLLNITSQTFSTYFQHFVSSNFSQEAGGHAYQTIGYNVDLEPPLYYRPSATLVNGFPIVHTTNGPATKIPTLNTSRTATVTVASRIEVLNMNAVATWLSIVILIWLTFATILISALQRTYFGSLLYNFDSPAAILVAIAGSDKFLDLVRERGYEALKKRSDVRARLGWFVDAHGNKRWGIEVVEREDGVSWDDPQKAQGHGGWTGSHGKSSGMRMFSGSIFGSGGTISFDGL
jgi:hypothetical protein